ncbi:MAG TPA: MBL fold metallo-hydrolase [Candidatus Koribacter sp.]|jgi:glyoxylase-like metal-dependent hydrolase (beta-lactamase superfamily II)
MRFVWLCAIFATFFAAVCLGQSSQPSLVEPDWCRDLPRPDYKSLERIPIDDPWFEAYRVAPGVIAIYEPHQWEETLVYLIQGKKSAILVDTGMGIGDLKSLVSKLTPLPIIVVNSHTHPDHTGNNWQFSTVYNLDTAYSREDARGGTEIRAEIAPDKICGTLPKNFDARAYATRRWKTTKWLHDGDRIDLGGRTIEVMATPGHAPDSLCLFDEANGLLFTGDLYYPGAIYVFGKGADSAEYQQSADRLAKLAPKVKKVFGAHNTPVSPPNVLSELAREFDAVRAGKIAGTDAGGGITQYKGEKLTFLVRNK